MKKKMPVYRIVAYRNGKIETVNYGRKDEAFEMAAICSVSGVDFTFEYVIPIRVVKEKDRVQFVPAKRIVKLY